MANKYDAPPPTYPQNAYTQQHYDAGPYPPNQYPPPQPASADYYGNPSMTASPHYGQAQPAPYQGPQQGYYGQQPGQGMYYQQPPPGAVPGYFADGRNGRRGTENGLCAAILGALACCCCLDFIF